MKGNECMKSKEYETSIDCYTKSIEIFPDEPATFSNRAMAYLKLKQYKNAIKDADKAISLKPDYIKAYHRRGKAHLGIKHYEAAIKDFQYILERDPHNKEINRDLLNARVALNDTEKEQSKMEVKASDGQVEEITIKDEDDKKEDQKKEPEKKESKEFKRVQIEEDSDSDEEEDDKDKKKEGESKKDELFNLVDKKAEPLSDPAFATKFMSTDVETPKIEEVKSKDNPSIQKVDKQKQELTSKQKKLQEDQIDKVASEAKKQID